MILRPLLGKFCLEHWFSTFRLCFYQYLHKLTQVKKKQNCLLSTIIRLNQHDWKHIRNWCSLSISGFTSGLVSYCTGLPPTNKANLHTIMQIINSLLSILVMIFAYSFNYVYLKKKHSPIILQEEVGRSKKSLYSFKKLLFGMFSASFLFSSLIIFQKYFLATAKFPFGMFLVCLISTLIIWNFSRKRELLDYFWFKIRQQTANNHLPRIRKTRVQPQQTVGAEAAERELRNPVW